jgi:regulator of sirC expression with transglutaminase-like and TPR domain
MQSEAEQGKERGNVAVKAGKWDVAVEEYTRALELQPDLLAAVGNRALAHLKLGHLDAAIQDCNTVRAIGHLAMELVVYDCLL